MREKEVGILMLSGTYLKMGGTMWEGMMKKEKLKCRLGEDIKDMILETGIITKGLEEVGGRRNGRVGLYRIRKV